MSIKKEWLDFLREQYPVGSRVKLRSAGEGAPDALKPGARGTLEHINENGEFHIAWDSGDKLPLVIGQDSFTVSPPPLQTLELQHLIDEIGGQASDGAGESFEQREIRVGNGLEIYAHLWQSGKDWSIQTEQERFGPKLAEGLPEMCFSTLKSTGELICIKRGESGYYPSDWNTSDRARNEEIAKDGNESLGVTDAQRKAMEAGSMFGWNCARA